MTILNSYVPEYNLIKDAFFPEFETKLSYLAGISQKEQWSLVNSEHSSHKYPILYNYLNYTYDRAKQEGKIAIDSTNKMMCFNTGLQTQKNPVDIYALFVEHRNYQNDKTKQRWYFLTFTTVTDTRMQSFDPLPDIVDYFTNPSDFVYDKTLQLHLDYDHIIDDNFERFKTILDYDKHIISALLEKSVKDILERLRRNYKIAVPQFYTDKNSNESKIQLLLPLCMLMPNKADLALVVDKEKTRYIGKTVLTLDWAYMNSRRIVKPDIEWLRLDK